MQIVPGYYYEIYGARFGAYIGPCTCGYCNGIRVLAVGHRPGRRVESTEVLVGSREYIIIPDRED